MVSIGQIIFNFLSHPAKLQTSVCLVWKKIDRNVHEFMFSSSFPVPCRNISSNLKKKYKTIGKCRQARDLYYSIVLYDIFSKFVPRNLKDPVVNKPKRTFVGAHYTLLLLHETLSQFFFSNQIFKCAAAPD